MIIEDDADILEILTIFLKTKAMTLLRQITVTRPNILLLDVRMHGSPKSGPQIFKDIKSSQAVRDLPVILISAEINLPANALDCGADDYLQKPFSIVRLLTCVQEHLPWLP